MQTATTTANQVRDEAPGGAALSTVLAVAVTVQTAGSFVSQGVYTLVPFWRDTFDLSQSSAALAVTAMNGGQILSMMALGRAIDRYGERSVVSLTLLAIGISLITGALVASSYVAVLALVTLLGALYASVQPGGARAILRWFPPGKRGLPTGLRQAAVPLGTAIAAFCLPLLATLYGWPVAVMAQGGIAAAGGVLFWALYREREGDGLTSAARPIPLAALIRQLLREKSFCRVLAAGIAMSAFQFTFTAHAISFMADGLGLGLVSAASFFAATQIIGILGRVLAPWLSDRFWPGQRARSLGVLMIAAAAAAVFFLALPTAPSAWTLVPVLAAIGFFGIGWYPLFLLEIAERAPRTAIAATIGFASTIGLLAMSLGPYFFGLVVDFSGYVPAWIALIVPVVLTALPLCTSNLRPACAPS
ncbi:MFS transporter [Microvirga sp. BT350]|uniref:MFS transporter n=2 Tax=Microvirga alba TaxID=2791025 RepID=A0A931BLG4_9HYPH|nr:MFS transporter [Microvirga alba]